MVRLKHCRPLSFPFCPPNDRPAEQAGDLVRSKIVVQAEEAPVERFIAQAKPEGQTWRIVFGREDERRRVRPGKHCRPLHGREREVVGNSYWHWTSHIPQLGFGELIRSRPGGQHGGAGEASDNLLDRPLVQQDGIAVAQVIFRSETIWGIDEEANQEAAAAQHCQSPSEAHATVPCCGAKEQNNGIERQQIPCEQCAAQHGKVEQIRNQNGDQGTNDTGCKRSAQNAVFVRERIEH